MIQEIPDKICKKCGGTTWLSWKDSRSPNPNKLHYQCKLCTVKRKLSKSSGKKRGERSKVLVCPKCGSSERHKILSKRTLVDGTVVMQESSICAFCKRLKSNLYYQQCKVSKPELLKAKNQRRQDLFNENPERRLQHKKSVSEWYKLNKLKIKTYQDLWRQDNKELCRAKDHRAKIKMVSNISDAYIRNLLSRLLGTSKKEFLRITPKQYEEYRQSLLIHRKLYPLKSKT